MAERERRLAPTVGGTFERRTQVMTAADVARAIRRMAHEILEHNHGATDLVIIGMQTGGVAPARRLTDDIGEIEGTNIAFGTLDATLHRDDFGLRPIRSEGATEIAVDIGDRVVVLVDDVLYTGRTVRAALDAIHSYGRPRVIRLAVMVDRGHRELPIRADFVGKNLPTPRHEMVDVHLGGVDLGVIR